MSKKPERNKPAIIRGAVVDSSGKKVGTKAMRADQIRTGGKRHESLPPELLDRAMPLWERSGKWVGITKEKWIDGFLHDLNPDKEIAIWERIADVIDELWEGPIGKKLTRENLARAVVQVSSGMVDVPSQVQGVTDKHVAVIRQKLNG